MIKVCTCKHEAQDKLHGKQKGVHNPCATETKFKQLWRCTVCLKEKE